MNCRYLVKYCFYAGNICNIMPVSQKCGLYIGNICSDLPLLQKCWIYNGNTANEMPVLQKFRIYTGDIGNEKAKYFPAIIANIGQNIRIQPVQTILGQYCTAACGMISDNGNKISSLRKTQRLFYKISYKYHGRISMQVSVLERNISFRCYVRLVSPCPLGISFPYRW